MIISRISVLLSLLAGTIAYVTESRVESLCGYDNEEYYCADTMTGGYASLPANGKTNSAGLKDLKPKGAAVVASA